MNQFLGIFVAAGTLLVDAQYTPVGKTQSSHCRVRCVLAVERWPRSQRTK
jgi:hypothetical protein